jgi:hypothetical protein
MQTAITVGAAGANDTQEESRLKAKALNQRSVSVAPASSARTHRNPRALTPPRRRAAPACHCPPPGPPAAAGRASCAAERRGELEQRQGCTRGFRPGSSRVPQSRT